MHSVGIKALKYRLSEYVRAALATMVFLRSRGLLPALATYDLHLAAAAVSEGFALADC